MFPEAVYEGFGELLLWFFFHSLAPRSYSGGPLEASWALPGPSWAVLGPSWAVLGASWSRLGPFWSPRLWEGTSPLPPSMGSPALLRSPSWGNPGLLGRPRSLRDASKTPQDAPKTPQDRPRWLQDGSRRPPDAPRRTLETPRRPQATPRRPQEAPRRLQDGPRRPRTAQDVSGGSIFEGILDRLGGVLEASWRGLGGLLGGLGPRKVTNMAPMWLPKRS